MDNERNAELIRTAVGAVRAPFAIVDMQIVRFRGEKSFIRLVPRTAIGLLDSLTALVVPDVTPGSSPRAATPPAAEPVVVPEAPTVPEAAQARAEQLAAERKSREHKASRSNKSVSAIARDLAVAEAVADAHEHLAGVDSSSDSDDSDDEPVVDVEQLTAKDFGPPSSS